MVVLAARDFQSIEQFRIVVGLVGHGALATDVERHIGVDLPGVLDWRDLAEHQTGCWIDRAFDAGAVVGLDALEIEADKLRRCDLPRTDRALHIGDGRLLEMEAPRRLGSRLDGRQYGPRDPEHGRANAS